jgi:hypothetical protein
MGERPWLTNTYNRTLKETINREDRFAAEFDSMQEERSRPGSTLDENFPPTTSAQPPKPKRRPERVPSPDCSAKVRELRPMSANMWSNINCGYVNTKGVGYHAQRRHRREFPDHAAEMEIPDLRAGSYSRGGPRPGQNTRGLW